MDYKLGRQSSVVLDPSRSAFGALRFRPRAYADVKTISLHALAEAAHFKNNGRSSGGWVYLQVPMLTSAPEYQLEAVLTDYLPLCLQQGKGLHVVFPCIFHA